MPLAHCPSEKKLHGRVSHSGPPTTVRLAARGHRKRLVERHLKNHSVNCVSVGTRAFTPSYENGILSFPECAPTTVGTLKAQKATLAAPRSSSSPARCSPFRRCRRPTEHQPPCHSRAQRQDVLSAQFYRRPPCLLCGAGAGAPHPRECPASRVDSCERNVLICWNLSFRM
jgi:hypothetical protein